MLEENQIDMEAYQYVNRLSDYIFMLARYCAKSSGKEEQIYQKAKKRDEEEWMVIN